MLSHACHMRRHACIRGRLTRQHFPKQGHSLFQAKILFTAQRLQVHLCRIPQFSVQTEVLLRDPQLFARHRIVALYLKRRPARYTMTKPLTEDGGVVTGIPEAPITQHRPVPVNLDQYIKNPGAPRATRAVCHQVFVLDAQLIQNFLAGTLRPTMYSRWLFVAGAYAKMTSKCRYRKRNHTALMALQTTGELVTQVYWSQACTVHSTPRKRAKVFDSTKEWSSYQCRLRCLRALFRRCT